MCAWEGGKVTGLGSRGGGRTHSLASSVIGVKHLGAGGDKSLGALPETLPFMLALPPFSFIIFRASAGCSFLNLP